MRDLIIGTATLATDTSFHDDRYECIAWWRCIRCQPQTVNLVLSDYIGSQTLHIAFQGITKDANFTSYCGGVAYGNYNKQDDLDRQVKFNAMLRVYAVMNSAFAGLTFDSRYSLSLDPDIIGVLAFDFEHKTGLQTHYRLIPMETLPQVKDAWTKIVQYKNVRQLDIPPVLSSSTTTH